MVIGLTQLQPHVSAPSSGRVRGDLRQVPTIDRLMAAAVGLLAALALQPLAHADAPPPLSSFRTDMQQISESNLKVLATWQRNGICRPGAAQPPLDGLRTYRMVWGDAAPVFVLPLSWKLGATPQTRLPASRDWAEYLTTVAMIGPPVRRGNAEAPPRRPVMTSSRHLHVFPGPTHGPAVRRAQWLRSNGRYIDLDDESRPASVSELLRTPEGTPPEGVTACDVLTAAMNEPPIAREIEALAAEPPPQATPAARPGRPVPIPAPRPARPPASRN